MTFDPNIPQPGDLLSDSQGDLLVNMTALNTSFGQDHYTFSDTTINNGRHREVTSPLDPVTPLPVTGTDPKLFGYKQTGTAMPVIHYSRAPTNAVESPVTLLQGPAAGTDLNNSTANVLDLTGFVRCYGLAFAEVIPTGAPDIDQFCIARFSYHGAFPNAFVTNIHQPAASFFFQFAGNVLQIRSTALAVRKTFWSVQLWRTN